MFVCEFRYEFEVERFLLEGKDVEVSRMVVWESERGCRFLVEFCWIFP